MAANGMITRHFEHPSGATATLEMPAGWSRNAWYELRTKNPQGVQNPVDRKTFNTPEEARIAAIAKEREALANGWKPRMAAMEPGESEAIELRHNREATINDGIESNLDLAALWGWLALRVKDASERQQVQAAIIRGRAERQARLQREQEAESMARARARAAEIDRSRQAMLEAVERTRVPLFRTESERLAARRQEQTDEALRRLSGGVDLNKPKKRKIDLGE